MNIGDPVRFKEGSDFAGLTGIVKEQGWGPYIDLYRVELDDYHNDPEGTDTWCFEDELEAV